MTPPDVNPDAARRMGRAVIWLPGLAVAVGAAIATAHGLNEVALAARVPAGIAWLYPLITDGLALVAYAATAKLTGSPARYAWSVVVVAAGLSGLAQAAFLASTTAPGTVGFEAPPALRFGIGAWPAVAAAVVAHLLYLLATDRPTVDVRMPTVTADTERSTSPAYPAVQPACSVPAAEHTAIPDGGGVQRHPGTVNASERRTVGEGGARARAEAAAVRLATDRRAWPTVTEVENLAGVSRGTAAAALKHLRTHHQPGHPLHLVTDTSTDGETRTNEATR